MRLLAASLCVAIVMCAGGVSASSTIHIALTFDHNERLPKAVLSTAIDEAKRLWARYGIVLHVETQTVYTGATVSLAITTDYEREAANGDEDLGEIRFSADGIPDTHITLYYRAIVRLASGSPVMGTETRLGPAALLEQAIGRVLGRALAHEIGHFVLRWPHHSSSGLMRSRQHTSALVDPSGRSFTLTKVDRARLQIVLDAQPAVAALQ